MDKKKIRFITNPFSGNKSKADLKINIDTFLDHTIFDYDIRYTEFPQHATKLCHEAKEAGYYAVIAVGGDGTINEVASALVHSNTALGIVPFGSGNGFSYHIGIRRSIIRAIETINTGYLEKIDTGLANGRFFINVAGLGLDASVAFKTKLNTRRGFFPYFINTLKESFNFRYLKLKINMEDKEWESEYAMAVIANGSIYGYDFAIAPAASIKDGLFDVILVKKTNFFRYVMLVFRMLNKSFHQSPLVEYYKANKITIQNFTEGYCHVDGEGFKSTGNIIFELIPKSLLLIRKKY